MPDLGPLQLRHALITSRTIDSAFKARGALGRRALRQERDLPDTPPAQPEAWADYPIVIEGQRGHYYALNVALDHPPHRNQPQAVISPDGFNLHRRGEITFAWAVAPGARSISAKIRVTAPLDAAPTLELLPSIECGTAAASAAGNAALTTTQTLTINLTAAAQGIIRCNIRRNDSKPAAALTVESVTTT
ncbi:MAG: hypothetical protein ACREJC_10780 [Tepidisphaeraceae bacterium]